MSAVKLFHKKQLYRGGIIEMVIWRLPTVDSERPHGLKYRLVYVKDGKRLVGYDNERGKGITSISGRRNWCTHSKASTNCLKISGMM